MKKKWIKTITAIVLLLSLTLTACTRPAPSGSTAPRESSSSGMESAPSDTKGKSMTLGQLADYFVKAADDYNPKADRAAVLEGFDEKEQATRLQMFVLAGRAFGDLPAPEGNGKNTAPPPVDLTDAPEWAWSVLSNLSNGGVLAASDLGLPELEEAPETAGQDDSVSDTDGTSSSDAEMSDGMEADPAKLSDSQNSSSEKGSGNDKMNASVTQKDAEIIAQRFFQAFGTNLKDNFYATVNKGELDALELPGDGSAVGGSSAVAANTDKQLHELILEIVNSGKDYPKGSPEQKIRDLYQSVLALEARNAAGVEPLRKYLEAVDAAQNFSELNAAIAMAVNELGNPGNGLFPMLSVTDTQDSSRKVMQLLTLSIMFSAEDYDDPDNEMVQEYREGMISQLIAAGESKEEAERLTDGILRMERALAEHASSAEEQSSLQSQTKRYTPSSLDELMPQAKPSELFAAIGLKSDTRMQVFDDKQFAAYATWFTEENLELFKAMQKSALISGFGQYLSQELAENFDVQGGTPEETANEAVQSLLSEELGQLYVDRYFPAESKAEIEKMVQKMIDAFKARIGRLDWMEESTKQEAIKKLDNMTVLIGYPDQWDFNNAEIKGVSEGGSYFANVAASEADKWKKMIEGMDEPVNPRRFPMAVFTVNAAASRNTNTLIFPAGILQAPFYDKNASFEANLGAIGSTIAHEITHMFDDGGAQYDATGTVRNWWADNDFTHFQELCKKAEEFYNGYEAAPGIPANGKETLSENISDIGGIACGLEVLSSMENPDYDAFFRSYTRQWLRTGSYETLAEMAQSDQHAPNILRANRVLSNFQEYFDTYGIKPGDGMYVAPEDRIVIW
ncbi:M13-type metalloendopeptidase [Qiania dongpingensis]|uniref:M13 family metallopeptidase n=1 Tax=Qiania dongpingensis TaxID=2763669 RepID=A0A7G9G2W2_9FIRM|nr:M13 family metallopeptidase [Qiania dongpingensis]QNM05144.1 M13 family metallopeptidase [Qiania dongpingensis]